MFSLIISIIVIHIVSKKHPSSMVLYEKHKINLFYFLFHKKLFWYNYSPYKSLYVFGLPFFSIYNKKLQTKRDFLRIFLAPFYALAPHFSTETREKSEKMENRIFIDGLTKDMKSGLCFCLFCFVCCVWYFEQRISRRILQRLVRLHITIWEKTVDLVSLLFNLEMFDTRFFKRNNTC